MRRADRLFQIVQTLRGRRLTTARLLAERLKVSERTIYRDIRDLSTSGVPVEGEAGVGYRLRAGFEVPPIMFTLAEVEALTAGSRIIAAWGGSTLSAAAKTAQEKIAAVLPDERRAEIERTRVYAPDFFIPERHRATMDAIHRAISARRVLTLDYRDAKDSTSQRGVRPLALYFWGNSWTLAAWCELREDFRTFRLDRINTITSTERQFREETGKRFEDFLRAMEE